MRRLTAESSGLYAVRTWSAEYLLDLDAATVTRFPMPNDDTPGASGPARLRRDGQELLVAVLTCQLALPMELVVQLPATPGVVTYRRTTPVLGIGRVR